MKAQAQVEREARLESDFSKQRWTNLGEYSKHTIFSTFEAGFVGERKDPYELLGVEIVLQKQIQAALFQKEQENDTSPVVVVDFGGMYSTSWLRLAESLRSLVESGRVVFVTTNIAYDLDQA